MNTGNLMVGHNLKTILITGAAGGIGSALSMATAMAGWQVIMLDKNKRHLEKFYDAIVEAGGVEPYLQPMDLSLMGPENCQQLAAALQDQFGGLDSLMHCAVLFSGLQPLDLIEPAYWMEQMQVNVNAPWLLTVALLPLLRAPSSSSLVFMCDEQASARSLWGGYGVSKAATSALAGHFRAELKSTGVSTFAIDPGPTRTALRSSVYHSENPMQVPSAEFRASQILSILESTSKNDEFQIQLSAEEE